MSKTDPKKRKKTSDKLEKGDMHMISVCHGKLCDYCLMYCKKRSNANTYDVVGHFKLFFDTEHVLYNN